MDNHQNQANNNVIVDLNFLQLIKYFYSQRIVIFIFMLAVPSMTGLYLFFVKKPIYTSSVKLVIDTNSKTNAIDDRMSYYFSQEQQAISKISQVEDFVNSKLFLIELQKFFKEKKIILPKYPELRYDLATAEDYILGQASTEVTPKVSAGIIFSGIGFGSDLEKRSIYLSVSSRKPKASAAMANLAAFVLLKYNHNEILKEEKSIINFLSEQTQKLERQLFNLEDEYVKLQKKYGIYSERVAKTQYSQMHLGYSREYDEIGKKIEENQEVYLKLKEELKSVQHQVGSNNNASLLYLKQLQKRLDLLNYQKAIREGRGIASDEERNAIKLKISSVMQRYKSKISNSKPFLTINPIDNIVELEKRIKTIKDKLFQLKARQAAQQKIITSSEKQIENLPKATQELMGLKRRIDLTANLFRELVIKLQETKIKEAGQVNDLKVITNAEANGRPAGLGVKKSYILSVLVGLALGLMILLLRFILIPTVRDQLDLEKIGIKVIGSLPFYRSKRKTVMSLGSSPSVILEDESVGYEANLIRKTRFLLQKEINRVNKMYTGAASATVLGVCSANANEGKTFFATNLSLSLSKTEQKVILIDIDFIKPDVRDYFSHQAEEGVEKVLVGDFEMRKRKVNDSFDILDAPSTDQNIADQLQGPKFRELLFELRQNYDVVIFDTPAAKSFLEPMIIAQYCDLLMMVVNQRMTLIDDVRKTLLKINDGRTENVLGVLNFTYEEYRSQHKSQKAS